jgi:hypothetical protein
MTPQYPPDIFDNNIRCGRDAWMAKPNGTDRLTQTADVIAGSEVGFRIGVNVVSHLLLKIATRSINERFNVGRHRAMDLPWGARSNLSLPFTSGYTSLSLWRWWRLLQNSALRSCERYRLGLVLSTWQDLLQRLELYDPCNYTPRAVSNEDRTFVSSRGK